MQVSYNLIFLDLSIPYLASPLLTYQRETKIQNIIFSNIHIFYIYMSISYIPIIHIFPIFDIPIFHNSIFHISKSHTSEERSIPLSSKINKGLNPHVCNKFQHFSFDSSLKSQPFDLCNTSTRIFYFENVRFHNFFLQKHCKVAIILNLLILSLSNATNFHSSFTNKQLKLKTVRKLF